MELINRKRRARMALFEVPFDKRIEIEKWLDKNIVRNAGPTTTKEIISIMNKNAGIDEAYEKLVEWYLLNTDSVECMPKQDGSLCWNISIFQEETANVPLEKISQTTSFEVGTTVFREWPTKNQKAYRNAIAKRKDNTILTSKRKRGDWTGLRLFLTNNGFEESRVGSTYPLEEIMKYYDFEKPNKKISYEFLRDRLLYDGLKEFDLDKPLKQRSFNITQPNLELRQRYRAAMKEGSVDAE